MLEWESQDWKMSDTLTAMRKVVLPNSSHGIMGIRFVVLKLIVEVWTNLCESTCSRREER